MKPWKKFLIRIVLAVLVIGRIDVVPPDWSHSALIWWAGVLAGVLVLAVGIKGTRMTVKIIPLSPDGAIRIKTFMDAQPTGIYPWRYSLNVDGSANFWTAIPLVASETISVFVRLIKWKFNEYLNHPFMTTYSLTVENAAQPASESINTGK